MLVIVDTPIWSLALRRSRTEEPGDAAKVAAWKRLVDRGEAGLLGVVRQELLSGLSDPKKFSQLRDSLEKISNIPLADNDFVVAASYANECRRMGVQGSPVDFLICAVSARLSSPIFTTDTDFTRYANYPPIRLFHPETGK